MLHLKTIVSRKTPLDGRLEIPEALAHRLSSTGFTLTIAGAQIPVRVEEMACSCARGAAGNHVHHFLACEQLMSLEAGANVSLMIDVDRGTICIESDD